MGNYRMVPSFWCWRQMPVPEHLQWLMAEMSHFTALSRRCSQDKAGLDWQLPPFLNCPTGHSRTHLYPEARHLLLKAKLFLSFQQRLFFSFFFFCKKRQQRLLFSTSHDKPCQDQCYAQQLVIWEGKREFNHLFLLLLFF